MIAKNLALPIRTESQSYASQGVCDDFVSRLLLFKIVLPACLICLSVSLLSLSFPITATRPEIQWMPWLLSLFVFGLAHGGIDHQLPTLLGGITMKRRSVVSFVAWYLCLMIAVLMIWRWIPDAGLVLFLLMSAYHFGQGDLYWSSAFGLHRTLRAKTEPTGRGSTYLPVILLIARGSLPAIIPFLFFPDQFTEITRHLGTQLTGVNIQGWAGVTALRHGLMVGVFLFTFGQIMISLHLAYARYKVRDAATVRAAITEIAETGLLLLLFTSASPILTIGTYFLVWHSPRHVVRLILLTKPLQELVSQGQLGLALIYFHRRALPLTAAAGGLLMLLWAAISSYHISAAVLITSAFLFVSAITFPHFLIVLWMDAKQSIWGGNSQPKGATR